MFSNMEVFRPLALRYGFIASAAPGRTQRARSFDFGGWGGSGATDARASLGDG